MALIQVILEILNTHSIFILDETFVLTVINMVQGEGIKPPKTIYAGGITEMTLINLPS